MLNIFLITKDEEWLFENEGCLFNDEGWILENEDWYFFDWYEDWIMENEGWIFVWLVRWEIDKQSSLYGLISINLQKHAHTTNSLCCHFSFDAQWQLTVEAIGVYSWEKGLNLQH